MYLAWIMIFIIICTITDIKDRNIYGGLCVLNIIAGIIVHILKRDISGKSLGAGIIIGIIFLIISAISKEKIGYGDSLVFLTIGVIAGGEKSLLIIFLSFLLCSVFSVAGIVLKKITFKSSVAFMPFVLLGTLATIILI